MEQFCKTKFLGKIIQYFHVSNKVLRKTIHQPVTLIPLYLCENILFRLQQLLSHNIIQAWSQNE